VPDFNQHVSVTSSARNFLTNRLSRHSERYFEIFRVFRKYELHHVAAEFGMAHRHEEEDDLALLNVHEEDDDHPEGLAYALEELGPCFIKLGQLLSTRPDLLPADYIAALSRLQSTVVPVPGDKIIQIVESELGAPIADLFQSFELEPLAAASMAQVHRATLHNGDEVVVKVQRPGVRQRIEIDIEVLHEVARFLTKYTAYGTRYGISQMVRELEHSLSQELDFRQEAENTRIIGRQIAKFERLTTPSVYVDQITPLEIMGREVIPAVADL
jgi:ubiquinone biosynthesis protein